MFSLGFRAILDVNFAVNSLNAIPAALFDTPMLGRLPLKVMLCSMEINPASKPGSPHCNLSASPLRIRLQAMPGLPACSDEPPAKSTGQQHICDKLEARRRKRSVVRRIAKCDFILLDAISFCSHPRKSRSTCHGALAACQPSYKTGNNGLCPAKTRCNRAQ